MPRIKQVLRCYVAGNGTRTISSLMDISRNTVKKYITTFNQSGKTIEEILAMDEPDLLRLFNEKPDPCPPQPKSDRYAELMDRMPEYARMLRKKSITKTMVYQRYRQEYPDGYMKSQFFRILQLYLIQSAPVAHLEHKAGDRMYVDFAGDRLHLIDRETGEKVPVEVFVAILPCSQLTYVEAVMSQKKEDFIHACENAFYFYSGTPQAIVPDNLKAAVTHPNKYESELNEDFAAFAEHYNCAALPARVRRPATRRWSKGRSNLSTGQFTRWWKTRNTTTWQG
ncbi:MAG: IS21 family transposase [Bacteroidales bacterium]|nr:IS21 family transposase [Bacteroidales bacterium]